MLVPASMKLLGRRNWYLPKWLDWLPHVEVEGPHNRPVAIPVPVEQPLSVGDAR